MLSGWNRTRASKGATDFAISETHSGVWGRGSEIRLKSPESKVAHWAFQIVHMMYLPRKYLKEVLEGMLYLKECATYSYLLLEHF